MIHNDKGEMTHEGDQVGNLDTPVLDFDINDDTFRACMPQNEDLLSVALQAAQMGTQTLLVREELKCHVKLRLLSAGKDISDTASDTSSSACDNPGLSPDEEAKRQRRRDGNKLAAQRCRQRKRELADQLQEEVSTLEARNKKLRTDVSKLMEEKASLVKLLQRHDKSTQCDTRFCK